MYWLDTTLLALVGLGAVLGMWSGLFWQLARLASLALAIYATVSANDSVTQVLNTGPLRDADVRVIQTVAYVLVFLAVYLVLYLSSRLIHRSIRAADLVLFDRFLGGLLGASKMVFVLSALCLGAASYQHPLPQEWMAKSRLAPVLAHGLEKMLVVIPDEYKESFRGTLESLGALMARNSQEGVMAEQPHESKKNLLEP